jgi:hypothetical protein
MSINLGTSIGDRFHVTLHTSFTNLSPIANTTRSRGVSRADPVKGCDRTTRAPFSLLISSLACLSSGVSSNSNSPFRRTIVRLCTRDIEKIDSLADAQRISAHHDHLLTGERAIKLMLVLGKLLPLIGFEPTHCR